ncbi:MAG TPA: histidine phosphatase family protein [Beutenbergiaceae bacterium]|nr:histidine phosphatase family protein [Beutenbergiaceae bacterium]
MATVLLIRHGRTTANAEGILAGRTPGIELDETGRQQAAQAGERLGAIRLAGVVTSPMLRCRQTSEVILNAQPHLPAELVEEGITECDYGQWQGRKIEDLTKEPMWTTVQTHPAGVMFPDGEAMATMQARAVAAIRRHDAAFEAEHGPEAVWAAVSHGDLIKSVLADALGMHLDLFQRIHAHPASVSIIRYTPARPYVVAMNTDAGDLSWLGKQSTQENSRNDGTGTANTGTDRTGDPEPAGVDAEIGGGAGPTRSAP